MFLFWSSRYKKVRKMLMEKGYQDRLPNGHPLIMLYARYLDLVHEKDAQACKNYIANVSRVLFFVSNWLKERDSPPKHWSQLFSCSEEPYVLYFEE